MTPKEELVMAQANENPSIWLVIFARLRCQTHIKIELQDQALENERAFVYSNYIKSLESLDPYGYHARKLWNKIYHEGVLQDKEKDLFALPFLVCLLKKTENPKATGFFVTHIQKLAEGTAEISENLAAAGKRINESGILGTIGLEAVEQIKAEEEAETFIGGGLKDEFPLSNKQGNVDTGLSFPE